MKLNSKKIVAFTLSAAMVIGSSITILAEDKAEGNTSGSGTMEGSVKTDVFDVVLPTNGVNTLNFKLDPETLISKTNGAALAANDTFEENATILFTRAEDEADKKYSSTSDKLTIVNKGTKGVDVTVEATATPGTGVTMTTDNKFANDTNASIYLALTDGTQTVAVDASTNKATMTAYIGAAPKEAYEYKYDATATPKYSYSLKSDTTGINFKEYSFRLTGAANANADWTQLTTANPSINVTWNVVPTTQTSAAPSITTTSYTLTSGTSVDISVSLGSGDLAATAVSKVMDPTGAWDYLKGDNQASFDATNKKITLSAGMVDACIAANVGSISVVFDDDEETTVVITLTK